MQTQSTVVEPTYGSRDHRLHSQMFSRQRCRAWDSRLNKQTRSSRVFNSILTIHIGYGFVKQQHSIDTKLTPRQMPVYTVFMIAILSTPIQAIVTTLNSRLKAKQSRPRSFIPSKGTCAYIKEVLIAIKPKGATKWQSLREGRMKPSQDCPPDQSHTYDESVNQASVVTSPSRQVE